MRLAPRRVEPPAEVGPQLGRAALASMTPEEIARATVEGRLNALLSGRDPDVAGLRKGEELTPAQWREKLASMTEAQFEQARTAGLIPAELLSDEPTSTDTADQGARGKGYPGTASGWERRLQDASPEQVREWTLEGKLDPLFRGDLAP
jgi:hypothetical protein